MKITNEEQKILISLLRSKLISDRARNSSGWTQEQLDQSMVEHQIFTNLLRKIENK